MREKMEIRMDLLLARKKVIGIIPGTIFLTAEKICYYSKIGSK
jgi:hypothetical protein